MTRDFTPFGRCIACGSPLRFLEAMYLGQHCEDCDDFDAVYDTWRSIIAAQREVISRGGKLK